jgi:hypothetical protein
MERSRSAQLVLFPLPGIALDRLAHDRRLREARQSDPRPLDRCRRQADSGRDGKPYATIGFANGPGASDKPGERAEITMEEATGPCFKQRALVPLPSETHGGEDLGICAIGPWSRLFKGTLKENYTFHVLDFASKISERAKAGYETSKTKAD